MDSLTNSDIDRIFSRLQEQIDLEKIKTKKEFHRKVIDNPKTKKWNAQLTDFFWDVKKSREKVIVAVPEIEVLPFKPTPIMKRKRTIRRKKEIISVKASYKQRSYTRHKGRIWKDEEIKFAQKLRQDGLTSNQIAIQLNRSASSVSTKLSRVSIK